MSIEFSRRNFLQFVGGAAGIALLGAAGVKKAHAAGVKIRLAGDSDVGQGGRWMRARAQEWAQQTGSQLEYISRPNSSTETLSLYDQYWAAQSPDVDVYLIDVIWPGIAAQHAIDAGLRTGDVILEINHQAVKDAEDAVHDTANPKRNETLVKIWSSQGIHYLTVEQSNIG
jgi:ABC-type glycerol-3-phosphate transport system substrate-binding protein